MADLPERDPTIKRESLTNSSGGLFCPMAGKRHNTTTVQGCARGLYSGEHSPGLFVRFVIRIEKDTIVRLEGSTEKEGLWRRIKRHRTRVRIVP
jgi:hypothetical protein